MLHGMSLNARSYKRSLFKTLSIQGNAAKPKSSEALGLYPIARADPDFCSLKRSYRLSSSSGGSLAPSPSSKTSRS